MKPNWIHLDTVSSTNSCLQEMLKRSKPPEWTVVVADYQELGRGQGAHVWLSERNQNLLMSVLLYPEFLSVSLQFQLSIMTSLAVCDTLQDLEISPVIKWPNDILTEKGKIAGILIEHGIMGGQLSHSILGIGLNVNQLRFPGFPLRATSLAMEKPGHFDIRGLSKLLTDKLMSRYLQLLDGGGEPLRDAYLNNLFSLNKTVRFKAEGKEFTGVIRGISEIGELLVESEGTIRGYGLHSLTYSQNERGSMRRS